MTGAVGTATVSVDATNEEIAVTLALFNFATGTTAGHIHVGPRGVAGPVVINFPIPAGRTGDLPLTFRLGAAAFVARPEIGIATMADAIQAIVGGGAYVNIHTSQYPAGEIRGQLTVVPVSGDVRIVASRFASGGAGGRRTFLQSAERVRLGLRRAGRPPPGGR